MGKVRSGIDSLKNPELVFIKELLADDLWRPTQAARKAGYKNPAQSARHLMTRPRVAKALGREQRRRLERLDLNADEVLNMLATGLFFNPLSLFTPTASGKWAVQNLDDIPDAVGRCISRVKAKTTEKLDDDGNTVTETFFEIEFMDKTRLLDMAMKHFGIDGTKKLEITGQVGIGLNGGLGQLLMDIEKTRSGQVVDGEVVQKRLE